MAVGLKIIDGDYVINNDGTILGISGNDKGKRDFEKMLLTDAVDMEKNPNTIRYNPLYGTKLNHKDLFKNVKTTVAGDIIDSLIREAVDYYLKLQENRTNLTAEEIITDIEIYTYPDRDDGRFIIIDMSLFHSFAVDK